MENDTISINNSKLEFTFYDYGLFLMMLILSALIGVYFGFIKKQSTANDYLLGGRDMSVFPIAMSLIASMISGITLLGVPADVYRFGATYWLCAFSLIGVTIASYYICIPVFYELQITSTYEYLERRFDMSVRTFASAIFTFAMFLYLPVVIYIPALALSQATGFNIHSITPIICGVCVFYTTFGGLKAVVWTDFLQFVVMVGTTIVVLLLGVTSAGGFGVIWQRSMDNGRLDIDTVHSTATLLHLLYVIVANIFIINCIWFLLSFSLNPTKRDTFWTGTIGTFFMWFSFVGCNQGLVQKCIALPNYTAVRNALILFAVGTIAMISFSCYTGLIIFSRYFDCDPLTSGRISQPDQLLPFYIMDVGGVIPGLPGLFTAGIFSAALSTLSAAINCLSATVYEDFISRFVNKGTTEKTISNYLKIVSVVIGIISTALVFFVPYMGGILQFSYSVGGVTAGLSLGLFLSGMLFPSINSKAFPYIFQCILTQHVWLSPGLIDSIMSVFFKLQDYLVDPEGVLWGSVITLTVMIWIVFSAQYYKVTHRIRYPVLPTMTHGCQNTTLVNDVISTTTITITSAITEPYETSSPDEPLALYKVSFYYYAIMGITIVIIFSLIISKFTQHYNKPVEKKYFSPIIRNMVKDADSPPDYYIIKQEERKVSDLCEKL